MSRRRTTVVGALAVLVTLAGAAPLSGQQTEAELQRSVDSLTVLVNGAAAAAQAARDARAQAELRLAEAEYSLDTVRVAGMTIVTRDEDAAEATELFAETWDETFRGYGGGVLRERTFTYLRAAYTLDPIPVAGPRQRVVVPVWQSREEAKARIRSAIAQVLAEDLDGTPLGTWLRGSPLSDVEPADIYRQMVLARSLAVDRCLADDLGSCTAALGLGPDGRSLSAWYSPEERRVRALEAMDYDETRGTSPMADLMGPLLTRCADRSTPDACDVFLNGRLDSFTPLSLTVRATLANRALELGGDGAWARLAQNPGMSPEEALANAARTSIDELVADWQAWVVQNRPEAQAGLGGDSALAILWVLFFAALATRSTRWRFA